MSTAYLLRLSCAFLLFVPMWVRGSENDLSVRFCHYAGECNSTSSTRAKPTTNRVAVVELVNNGSRPVSVLTHQIPHIEWKTESGWVTVTNYEEYSLSGPSHQLNMGDSVRFQVLVPLLTNTWRCRVLILDTPFYRVFSLPIPPPSGGSSSQVLQNRTYHFDGKTFWPAFQKITHLDEQIAAKERISIVSFNAMKIVQENFRNLLCKSEGEDFAPPASVFLNDRLSQVVVRGTSNQCQAVKHLLAELGGHPQEEKVKSVPHVLQ